MKKLYKVGLFIRLNNLLTAGGRDIIGWDEILEGGLLLMLLLCRGVVKKVVL